MAPITLNFNGSVLQAQRALGFATGSSARGFERLATGQRINRASDDAAGIAIADRLRTDSRLFSVASRNISDGLSMINVASGALTEQNAILFRLTELAEQSANGTYSAAQRAALDDEYQTLVAEFGRIGDTTRFNNMNLLRAHHSGEQSSIQLQTGINGSAGSYTTIAGADTATLSGTIDIFRMNFFMINLFTEADTLDEIGDMFLGRVIRTSVVDRNGVSRELLVGVTANPGGAALGLTVFQRGSDVGQPAKEWVGDSTTFTQALIGGHTALVADDVTGLKKVQSNVSLSLTFATGTANFSIDLSGLRFRDSGLDYTQAASAPASFQATTAVNLTGIETANQALNALTILRARLENLSQILGGFGATARRLEVANQVVEASRENYQSAESRIRDADIAQESAALIRNQILQQTATQSMGLAQQQPQLLLSLLLDR